MSIDPNERIFIEGELLTKREKAIRLLVREEEVWLPTSQIIFDETAKVGQTIDVELPIWLARDKDVFGD